MQDSIFTKIIKREIPAKIIFEDSDMIAFEDIDPKAPLHVLIVPKKQIETLNSASEEDALLLGKILLRAANIAKERGISESGYRITTNCNKDGGQSVFHIHFHLMGGRPMAWPPG